MFENKVKKLLSENQLAWGASLIDASKFDGKTDGGDRSSIFPGSTPNTDPSAWSPSPWFQ